MSGRVPRRRTIAGVALLAAAAVLLSVLARLVVAATLNGPPRALAHTELQYILANWPFLTLHWPYLRFPSSTTR